MVEGERGMQSPGGRDWMERELFIIVMITMGDLEGMISSQVDDFILAGTDEFVKDITGNIKEKLDISKLEDDKLRFTRIDVKKEGETILISMDEYTRSLEILEIRKGKSEEELTEVEMKTYRNYIGKFNWLGSNTKQDLSIYVKESVRKQKKETLKDFRYLNRDLDKVEEG